MAAPNIVNVTTINGKSVVADLGTTLTTTLLTCAADQVNKINLIRVTNVTDNDATTTIDSEVSGTHKKFFYLQETDLIRGGASAASTLEVTISYELIDDA
jgi:predicted secreted protein